MANVTGGGGAVVVLQGIVDKLAGTPTLRVGFLEGATYPARPPKALRAAYRKRRGKGNFTAIRGAASGTPNVATVAAWNEFGTGTAPPRPFFRNMIRAKSHEWGPALAHQLEASDYDADKSLAVLGEGIVGQLKQSIVDTMTPPNAPSTVAKKGFQKPLIDSSHMLASTDYELKT